ncbi:MobC family replication-relaxation protein [uncultured Vibrio sp.]|uniref:MobC family replication-relaxation protein n=1 Tax=uncultured Vibrio sp. TaxID=114054 RepID=UPI002630CBD9|nr:MobC family replication-relaxation protein [uncultured Vibrio sp.]
MNNGMHISEAKLRGKEHEMNVLTFLHQEIFSNYDNLMALIKIKQPNLSRLLTRMVKKRLLEKHVLTLDTCKVSLWGITQLGIEQAGNARNAPLVPFTPSRLSLTILNHTLMTQRVYIALKHLNWTGWRNGDRQAFKQQFALPHRPDAIVTTPMGTVMAIETELTIKNVARYRSIIKSHIQAKGKGFWGHVIYVVRNQACKEMLQVRFDNIKYIPFDESRHPFETYSKLFSIFTVEEMKLLNQTQ